SYTSDFNAPIAGSVSHHFKPDKAGVYTFEVSATDRAGNMSNRVIEVRAIESGSGAGGVDGPPVVSRIIPANDAQEVLINNPVEVFFNEAVDFVRDLSFKLVDSATGYEVPAFVYTTIYETPEGRISTKAVLQPKNNLAYGRKYDVILTKDIKDIFVDANVSDGGVPLSLASRVKGASEYKTSFTTIAPRIGALIDDRFTGGSTGDVAVYEHGSGNIYTYVTANENGWYVINVTSPTNPVVVHHHRANNGFSFRGVAVDNGIMAMTDTVNIYGGGQYGYVRFYDLRDNPELPTYIGQERLAEDWSGIPWRVAINGNLAYVATVMVGIQVVDIEMAENYSKETRGQALVGNLAIPGLGYGNPSDLAIIKGGKMLVTTTTGRLVIADINQLVPQVLSVTGNRTEVYSAFRVDAATEFSFYDTRLGESNLKSIIDIAVTNSFQGEINTVDISDPYNPVILGTAVDSAGVVLDILARDVKVSKTSGMAFVASSDAIYIIDIKDPINPKLVYKSLQTMTSADDESKLFFATGIIEKDGTIYVADRQAGLKVLNTRKLLLKQSCDENNFFACNEFYPALAYVSNGVESGKKRIILEAKNSDNQLINDGKTYARLRKIEPETAGVRLKGKAGARCPEGTPVFKMCALFEKGHAEFHLTVDKAFPWDTEELTMTFDIYNTESDGKALEEDASENKRTTVELKVRTNANVNLQEVLDGTAVYTFEKYGTNDLPLDDLHKGKTTGNEPKEQGFDYVQMMLNYIIPPLKTPVREANLKDSLNISGWYGGQAFRTIKAIINTTADGFDGTLVDSKISHRHDQAGYKSSFEKINKEYNYYDYTLKANTLDEAKVIDKELLVGFDLHTSEIHPINDEDIGIYELFQNEDWDRDGISNFVEVENSKLVTLTLTGTTTTAIEVTGEETTTDDKNYDAATIHYNVTDGHIVFDPLTETSVDTTIQSLLNTTRRGTVGRGEMLKSDSTGINDGEYAFSKRIDGIRIPSANKGYYYRRGGDFNDTDNYALRKTIEKLERIGKKWAEMHPDLAPMNAKVFSPTGDSNALKPATSGVSCTDGNVANYGNPPSDIYEYNDPVSGGTRFGVGDFSRPGGGFFYSYTPNIITSSGTFNFGTITNPVIIRPDHKSHEAGVDIDVRYVRRKACGEGGIDFTKASRKAYDRELTFQLMTLFAEEGAVAFYVDVNGRAKIFNKVDPDDEDKQKPKAEKYVAFNNYTVLVDRVDEHHHHFHVKFPDPYEPLQQPTAFKALDYTQDPVIDYGSEATLNNGETVTIESDVIRDNHGWGLFQKDASRTYANFRVYVRSESGNAIGTMVNTECSKVNDYRLCKIDNNESKIKFTYTTHSTITEPVTITIKSRDGSYEYGKMKIIIATEP
ncbi:MAG: Ig-like domain-containing protein, partial [Deltaproteobacteria bacterium]|nr:Ig-like domain-containing protein [Deltaproteobacteria bacterium]